MTEAKWLTATDPAAMSRFLCDELRWSRQPIGRRKLRLYACACCRPLWPLLDERSRAAVEMAERYADGAESKAELERVWNRGQPGFLCQAVCDRIGGAVVQAPYEASHLLGLAAGGKAKKGSRNIAAEQLRQVALLRDIVGNPFRPVAVDPTWLSSTAVAIAQAIYADRAFDRLPILADALQDAGCEDEQVLAHCRGDGPHVRGCWVVDGVLGKG